MKVTITSDGTRNGTRVTTEDGRAIPGLTEVRWGIDCEGGFARADLEMAFVRIDRVNADASVYVGGRVVRRIEYADGTIDDFPA